MRMEIPALSKYRSIGEANRMDDIFRLLVEEEGHFQLKIVKTDCLPHLGFQKLRDRGGHVFRKVLIEDRGKKV